MNTTRKYYKIIFTVPIASPISQSVLNGIYTRKEREYYNEQRKRTCETLGITKNQYNWLRRKGQALHKIYEDSCNGMLAESDFERLTDSIYDVANTYVKKLGLFVFYQTDPRGATIYLDTKEIPENNYTQTHCIY